MPMTSPAALPADWRDLLALTKPRVMSLVVFTGLCGLLAAPVMPPPGHRLHRDPVHRAWRRRRRGAQPMV
jgi:heme O synthase-like polyprenyltransferase